MFNFKKKNDCEIAACCDGLPMPLDEVNDPMFSGKMIGDGFAIKPTNDYIVSPIQGEVVLVFPTKHAIGLKNKDGIEIMIHVGMDTVNENGKGFEVFVNVGDKVKKGTTLIKIDREYLSNKGYDLTTPCIITNMNIVESIELNLNSNVMGGKTTVLSYKIK